jgi:hypothetical protein
MPIHMRVDRGVAKEVARQMGLSTRTLSRKLGEEKTSFAEILDQSRAALASVISKKSSFPCPKLLGCLAAWLSRTEFPHTGMTLSFRSRRSQPS